jgi:zinc protease
MQGFRRIPALDAQSIFHFPFSIGYLPFKKRFNSKGEMLRISMALLFMIIGLCVPANGQKDDQKKTGDQQDSRPVLVPANPYREVTRESLLNGMQIVTLGRSGEKSVKLDLIIRGGDKFDLAGKAGLAKLTQETLLIVNPNLKEELGSLNASIDWGVDSDTTWFHIESPLPSLDTALEIVGRLLVVENIRPDAFKRAQEEHINRIKLMQLSHSERADDAFMIALFGNHPYGHNIDGSVESVAAVKLGDVYDFMKRFYISNNAFAVVTGNITSERALRPFKMYFGGWTKGQIIPATFLSPKQVAQLNLVKIDAPDAPNVEIRGGVLGVKCSDPDYLATEVLARVLAARLKKDAGGFTVKSSPRVLPGPFYFSASVPAEQAPASSRTATEIFSALSTAPLSAVELAAAKADIASEYSSQPPEYYLRLIETYSLARNFPLEVAKKIEAISAPDLERVSKKLLEKNALTVVVLGKVSEGFKTNP